MTSSDQPSDNIAYRYPVSVKGVIQQDNSVVLLKNERNEWELPGGKLELGEAPEVCVAREIEEELGLKARTGPLLDVWVYHISEGVTVFMVTFGCIPEPFTDVVHSAEHKEVGIFSIDEVPGLNMPQGYKDSIIRWDEYLRNHPGEPK